MNSKTMMIGALVAVFSGSALGAGMNDETVNLKWDLPPLPSDPCAIRVYNKIPPNVIRRAPSDDPFPTFGKTLNVKESSTGRLPTSTSVIVKDFYAISRPVVLFVSTALYPAAGKSCAQSLTDNTYIFSPESNLTFTSQDKEFFCPEESEDRDGDGMCDDFEINVSHSAVASANSDGDTIPDDWEYALWEEYEPRAGEMLCPNGKYPLKTQDCDNDGHSDKEELLNFHNSGGTGALDPLFPNP